MALEKLTDLLKEMPGEWSASVGGYPPTYHVTKEEATDEAKRRAVMVAELQGGDEPSIEIERAVSFELTIPPLVARVEPEKKASTFDLGRAVLAALSEYAAKVQKLMRAEMAPAVPTRKARDQGRVRPGKPSGPVKTSWGG